MRKISILFAFCSAHFGFSQILLPKPSIKKGVCRQGRHVLRKFNTEMRAFPDPICRISQPENRRSKVNLINRINSGGLWQK